MRIIKADVEKVKLLKKQFGLKIVELRQIHGLTQDDLAYICDTSVRTVQRVEAGESPLKFESLIILAKVFNIDMNELIEFCAPNKEMIFIDR